MLSEEGAWKNATLGCGGAGCEDGIWESGVDSAGLECERNQVLRGNGCERLARVEDLPAY